MSGHLIPCAACAHPISETAETCPHCGDARSSQREPLFTALVNIRNTELSVYWTRYNIQAVLNIGFAAAAITTLVRLGAGQFSVKPLWRLLFGTGGVLLALIWIGFTYYGKRLFVDGWEEWIVDYEQNSLMQHYDSKDPAKRFLLFSTIKGSGWHSPIHPERKAPKKLEAPKKPPLFDRMRLYNLGLLAFSLPTLILFGWSLFLTFPRWKECLPISWVP